MARQPFENLAKRLGQAGAVGATQECDDIRALLRDRAALLQEMQNPVGRPWTSAVSAAHEAAERLRRVANELRLASNAMAQGVGTKEAKELAATLRWEAPQFCEIADYLESQSNCIAATQDAERRKTTENDVLSRATREADHRT